MNFVFIFWRRSWCNGFCRRKWTRRTEVKSWMSIFTFCITVKKKKLLIQTCLAPQKKLPFVASCSCRRVIRYIFHTSGGGQSPSRNHERAQLASFNSFCVITFTFGLMPLGERYEPSYTTSYGLNSIIAILQG